MKETIPDLLLAAVAGGGEAEGDRLARLLRLQESERRQLAQDLHDSAGQTLTAIALGLMSLQDKVPPGPLRQELAQLTLLTVEATDEIRRVARGLRPSALETMEFSTAMNSLATDVSGQGALRVDVHLAGFDELEAPLPPVVELSLYRIVQEALTNVLRYAEATVASLILTLQRDRVLVIVEDDGVGFDVASERAGRGLGLRGIRERAALLGAQVEIESRPGHGTTVYVELPLSL